MWPFKKKEQHQIYFTCDEWAIRKYAPIQPAKKFLPLSFKDMETFLVKKEHAVDSVKTIKSCPGIVDFCSSGFVIPAWCDMEINPSPDGQNVSVRYSHPKFKPGNHPPAVIQDFMSTKFNVRMSVKLDNPWYMWAAEGYSLMYFPMYYYDDTNNWEALPGIIDHDIGAIQSPINIMLKEPKQTMIKMGEPLVQVVPFKREAITAYTGAPNDITRKRYFGLSYLHDMAFSGWMKYMREKKSYSVDAHDVELPTNPKEDSND
jgi:hypothetical protein